MKEVYDFPVALRNVYTFEGLEVPRIRAVVREDTKAPISAVSDQYKLIEHKEVVAAARDFISVISPNYKEVITLNSSGARMLATFTYKNVTNKVGLNDTVGLRIHVLNSYNKSSAVHVKIGALVLSCLNGMVTSKDAFSYSFRHTGETKITLPDPNEVAMHFDEASGVWRSYSTNQIDFKTEVGLMVEENVIPEKSGNLSLSRGGGTVWDLMQNATYYVTHVSKASPLGRLDALGRISNYIEQRFTTN